MTRRQLNFRAFLWLFPALFFSRFATVDAWGLIAWCGIAFMVAAAIDLMTTEATVPRPTRRCTCVPVFDPTTHAPLHAYGCDLHS